MKNKYLRGLNKASVAVAKNAKPYPPFSVVQANGKHYLILHQYIGKRQMYLWKVLCSNGYTFQWWVGCFVGVKQSTVKKFILHYEASHKQLRDRVFKLHNDALKILPD